MTENTAITLDRIHVSFAKNHVLNDLSLKIPKGSIQGIIGPSGTGKTTLIRVINGLKKAQKGSVKIFEQTLNSKSLSEIRPKIGYIPQETGLINIMTAEENVLMGGLSRVGNLRSIFKIFPKKEISRARELLDILGLSSKFESKVYQLSGGEKRRVAIARALMQDPKLLLADEILSDLDFLNSKFIMQKLEELNRQLALTIVMVEHNLCNAHEFSDQIAYLQNGKIKNFQKRDISHHKLCKLFQ